MRERNDEVNELACQFDLVLTKLVSLQNPLFDLVCLCFLCYFLFVDERDIKGKKKKYNFKVSNGDVLNYG